MSSNATVCIIELELRATKRTDSCTSTDGAAAAICILSIFLLSLCLTVCLCGLRVCKSQRELYLFVYQFLLNVKQRQRFRSNPWVQWQFSEAVYKREMSVSCRTLLNRSWFFKLYKLHMFKGKAKSFHD